jgi:hypothetical protein
VRIIAYRRLYQHHKSIKKLLASHAHALTRSCSWSHLLYTFCDREFHVQLILRLHPLPRVQPIFITEYRSFKPHCDVPSLHHFSLLFESMCFRLSKLCDTWFEQDVIVTTGMKARIRGCHDLASVLIIFHGSLDIWRHQKDHIAHDSTLVKRVSHSFSLKMVIMSTM